RVQLVRSGAPGATRQLTRALPRPRGRGRFTRLTPSPANTMRSTVPLLVLLLCPAPARAQLGQPFDFYARGPYRPAVPRPEAITGYPAGGGDRREGSDRRGIHLLRPRERARRLRSGDAGGVSAAGLRRATHARDPQERRPGAEPGRQPRRPRAVRRVVQLSRSRGRPP